MAALAEALGMPWGSAWVLGAAVAPTDDTAVGAVSRLHPQHNVTLLRAESFINDGTALVIYSLAVGVTVGSEHLSAAHIRALVALSHGGGIAAGAVVAWFGIQLRHRVRQLGDTLLDNLTIILMTFAAYLVTEQVEASGVLAVVVCGLIMSQAEPSLGRGRGPAAGRSLLVAGDVSPERRPVRSGRARSASGGPRPVRNRPDRGRGDGGGGGGCAGRRPLPVPVRLGLHHQGGGPASAAARTPDGAPGARDQRSGRLPRSRLPGSGPVRALTLDCGTPFPNRDTIVFVTAGVVVAHPRAASRRPLGTTARDANSEQELAPECGARRQRRE
ncbi:cation:proton antiporter domain-containing protein [Streptomyces sp. MN13]